MQPGADSTQSQHAFSQKMDWQVAKILSAKGAAAAHKSSECSRARPRHFCWAARKERLPLPKCTQQESHGSKLCFLNVESSYSKGGKWTDRTLVTRAKYSLQTEP